MRRRKTSAVKPATVIATVILCAAACLAGIGYVWAKAQVWKLSQEMKKLEVRRDELKRHNDSLERIYAGMCTPERLDQRVRELNLGLFRPPPSQIVRLPEPAPMAQRQRQSQTYVARTNE